MPDIRRPSDAPLSATLQKRLKNMVKKASYGSRYHEFRLKGKHPLRLLGTPKDPWQGSMAAASHILLHHFFDGGQSLKNPNHPRGEWREADIWTAMGLSQNWQRHIHSFCWLRDLDRALDRNAARNKTMELTRHWLDKFDHWEEMVWAPDVLGQRITNWMAYAPLIMDSHDLVYRSKLLNCLARQARHLYHTGDDDLRGKPRFWAISGLILAGLYIPYGEAWLKKATDLLNKALTQDILQDGGAVSRNPEESFQILRILLVVRLSYKAMGHKIPDKLNEVCDLMAKQLAYSLHGDGKLALFNGANEQDAEAIKATFSILGKAPVGSGTNLEDTGESGFRRLQQGRTVLLLDAGLPIDKNIREACHAGTLSFEMSSGPQRMIGNCGAAAAGSHGDAADLNKLSRTTAAHSTLVINNKNSSEVRENGTIGRTASMVTSQIIREQGHNLIEASHDGYLARFGIVHHRMIYMNDLGNDIRGEDCIDRAKASRKQQKSDIAFDLRFHLHPDITATLQRTSNRILIRLPGSEYWQFQCSGGEMSLADSLYLGIPDRPRNCRQIVVSGPAHGEKTVIKWSLRQIEDQNR